MDYKKKIFFVVFISVYIYLFFGFLLHTSLKQEVLGKYSFKYALGLLIFVFLFPFLIAIFKYCFTVSKLKLKTKKITVTPQRKILLLLFISCSFFLISKSFIFNAINHKEKAFPYSLGMKNFHPFLQSKLLPDNNTDNQELHINSESFRYDEITKEKSSDTYRIFVMGGSTVENATVSYEQNLVRLLEKKIQQKYKDKKIQVINAGNSGYTSEHSLIQYLFHVRDFDPDMIILWQGINDMYYSCDTIATIGSYRDDYSHYLGVVWPLVRSYYDPKPVISVNIQGVDIATNLFSTILYSDIRNYISDIKINADKPKYITIKDFPSIRSFERNMTYFTKIVQMDGIKLVLASQPYLYRTDLPNSKNWIVGSACGEKKHLYPDNASLVAGIESFNAVSEKISKEYGVSFVDIESHIPKTSTYFVDDVHFTKKGNEKVADIIFGFLTENNILPWQL
ncbi:MAG: SGNH/GDSL hydrolase family protein [Candidatus Levybacteria bacterium]|nr:SGNH/GDSL hydrolase family protein [Candidatus Levybacteria bacterium]